MHVLTGCDTSGNGSLVDGACSEDACCGSCSPSVFLIGWRGPLRAGIFPRVLFLDSHGCGRFHHQGLVEEYAAPLCRGRGRRVWIWYERAIGRSLKRLSLGIWNLEPVVTGEIIGSLARVCASSCFISTIESFVKQLVFLVRRLISMCWMRRQLKCTSGPTRYRPCTATGARGLHRSNNLTLWG